MEKYFEINNKKDNSGLNDPPKAVHRSAESTGHPVRCFFVSAGFQRRFPRVSMLFRKAPEAMSCRSRMPIFSSAALRLAM